MYVCHDAASERGVSGHDRRPLPTANVFPTAVTDTTRKKDYKRAGIVLVDEVGRVADLLALRTTLGTQLARAGVAHRSPSG